MPNAPKVADARPRPCRANWVREREETAWVEVGLGILFARMGQARKAGNGTGVR